MLSSSSEPEVVERDPLSEVLQDLRITGVSYGRCEVSKPWGIDFPPQGPARFHFVARGSCWLHSAPADGSSGWVPVEQGDLLFFPRGTEHALADRAQGRTKPIDSFPLEEIGDRLFELHAGDDGDRASILLCGSVNFEEPAVHPLLELMPSLLWIKKSDASDPLLLGLLEGMAEEVIARRVGAATVMTRLADVVIARVIRAWVETRRADTSGWLAAIRDPKIGVALAAIHQRPGEPWSVESLAELSNTSRSIFSERFASLVGLSPARYLARWRMHLASVWLQSDQLSVAEMAMRLGYESEASFSRAFKKFRGVPPGALRRQLASIERHDP